MDYSIKVLEDELLSLQTAMRTFSEKSKIEYSGAWKDRVRKCKQLEKAIEKLAKPE